MPKPRKPQENLKKEDVFQAVLIADDFGQSFSDFTKECSPGLLPIVNTSIIDYALEFLGRSGIQEVVVFCCSHADAIKNHVSNSKWSRPASSMSISIIVSEKCQSLGDAMRDIDNKALIKGDFVLLSAFTISNINLLEILEYHREKTKKDKGNALTLIMQDVGSSIPKANESVVGINSASDRLLLYTKPGLAKKLEIPLEYLLDNPQIDMFSNLLDTGIAICSPSVPVLFADNFDFQTKEDFIRGLLLNEEILDGRIYCYQIEHGYGATVWNWQMYQQVSGDIIHRWTFPLVPDEKFTNDEPFCHYRNCIYKQKDIQFANTATLEMDVVIGKGSQLGNNVRILRSVIGRNCEIGNDVYIQDSYIFDNCIIKGESTVQLSVIGEHCTIGNSCKVTKCFLKHDVVLKKKSKLEDMVISSKRSDIPDFINEQLSESAFAVKKKITKDSGSECGGVELLNAGLFDPDEDIIEEELDQSSESDPEDLYSQSPEVDDTMLFFNEVVDSLQRGFEEKLSCDNLILEINSSRYAYNVTLSEVTSLTIKAILSLPIRVKSTSRALLVYFLPLLKNYVKSTPAQLECLGVVEDVHEELGKEITKCLHFLYDSDILSEENIIKWHNGLENESPIRTKIAPFIKWLQEAAEETSTEESA